MRRDEVSWQLTAWLYLEGFSLKEVSRLANVAPTTVWFRLQKQGIPLRSPGAASGGGPRLSVEEIDKTVYLYVNMDLSAEEVARILDLSKSTVMYRIHKAGVARTPREQQEKALRSRRRRAKA